jgi:23S rRNA pseudouridine1911/1915/1917 synthase
LKQGKSIISAGLAAAPQAGPLRAPGEGGVLPEDALSALEDAADAGPEAELRPFVIDAPHHGERLDRTLAALAPEFSRSYLQQLIEAGAVSLNGSPATRSSAKVKAGDQGVIELRPTPQSQAFRAEAMVLDVLYEDEHLLVVNKPAGLVVHPAPGNWSGTTRTPAG